jgi:hypothetical protein
MANVFVFGSNMAGRHGKGSALEAKLRHGAVQGKGIGRANNSYAIPTKGFQLQVLPLQVIELRVKEFIQHAVSKQCDTFNVVAIGCGLAGYTPEQIGPMFKGCPSNVNLPEEFLPYA